MKKVTDLNKVELALRGLIYAAATRHKQHINHPAPLGEIFLDHTLKQCKEICVNFRIPLIDEVEGFR